MNLSSVGVSPSPPVLPPSPAPTAPPPAAAQMDRAEPSGPIETQWKDQAALRQAARQGALPVAVPEIAALKPGEQFPASLLTDDRYSVNQISESLVARLHNTFEPESAAVPQTVDLLKDTELQWHFRPQLAEGVMAHGVENQFQTQTSTEGASLFSSDWRLRVADSTARMPLGGDQDMSPEAETKFDAILPKSMMLALHSDKDPGFAVKEDNPFPEAPYGPQLWGYGPVVAVLDDSLKSRATMTPDGTTQTTAKDSKTLFDDGPVFKPGSQVGYVEASIWGDIPASEIKEYRIPHTIRVPKPAPAGTPEEQTIKDDWLGDPKNPDAVLTEDVDSLRDPNIQKLIEASPVPVHYYQESVQNGLYSRVLDANVPDDLRGRTLPAVDPEIPVGPNP